MSDRREKLQGLLMRALETPNGIIVSVTGDGLGKRQNAITALHSIKRELLPDVPQLLDIQIKPVAGRPDEIAIQKLNNEVEV